MSHRARIFEATAVLILCASAAQCAPAHEKSAKKLAGYNAIVVEAFHADEKLASEGDAQQVASTLQNRAVEKLQQRALFRTVVDAAVNSAPEEPTREGPVDLRLSAAQVAAAQRADGMGGPQRAAVHERRLILNATIVSFSKGNRATRYLGGFGIGESKLKVRFTLSDAKSRARLLSWEQTGTFKGTFSPFGGSSNKAEIDAANGVVKGLLKKIEENR